MCFYQRPGNPVQVIGIHFFVMAPLMGGRAPDQGLMHISQVIHVERSVTPIIFAIVHRVLCIFFKKVIKHSVCLRKGCNSPDNNNSAFWSAQ